MAATTECWLLNDEGSALCQCQPGEIIGGIKSKHLPDLGSSLTLDRMGDLWFASRVVDGGGRAVINGETIDDKAPCLLAEGDNRLQLGGGKFILRISPADAPAESGTAISRRSVGVSRQLRVLELVSDPVFHAGQLAEAMAKATFEGVEIFSADRASLWLYRDAIGKDRVLEMRANFKEGGFAETAGRFHVVSDREMPAALRGLAGQYLSAAEWKRGQREFDALRAGGIVHDESDIVLAVAVGGGLQGSQGFLFIERRMNDREPWSAGDLLAAQCLASCVLQALEARDKRKVIGKLEETKAFMAAELNAASNYVQKVLPPPIPRGPVRAEWQFVPSSQLGGDSFFYEWVSPRHFVCYILDVVGHGTGASLLAVSVMNAVRSLLLRDAANPPAPAVVLSHLNASFPMEQQSNLTFSMWFGLFDMESRELIYASGGHPPALLVLPDGDTLVSANKIELGVEDVAVGSWPDYPYAEGKIVVPARSKLFLYSDGAFEIPVDGGRQWNFAEFCDLLGAAARMAGGEAEYLQKKIRSLLAAPGFPDDFSLVCLSFDENSG